MGGQRAREEQNGSITKDAATWSEGVRHTGKLQPKGKAAIEGKKDEQGKQVC